VAIPGIIGTMSFMTVIKDWFKPTPQLHIGIETGRRGQRPLVLLHGIGSSGPVWRNVLRKAGSWHGLGLDLLGFGKSPTPIDIDYNLDDHTRAVAKAIRCKFGLRPVTIMAHSMGCLIAIELTKYKTIRIKRLVLYEPPLLTPTESQALNRKFSKGPSYQKLYNWIAGKPQMMIAYSRVLARFAMDTPPFMVDEDNWEPISKTLRNAIVRQGDTLKQLENINVRTDIAYGRFDFVVDSRTSRRRLAHNPKIHFHQVTDTHGITRVSSAQLVKILNQPDSTETTGPA